MAVAARAAVLSGIEPVRHGFFERQGGVSEDIYASLNCGRGSDDLPSAVEVNRRRVADQLGIEPDRLLSLYQIHSPQVEVVTKGWPPMAAPRADAMVTVERGLGLGILTADCAPVLFADTGGSVIAAAHAGWKGALGGVLENTVETMIDLGADKKEIRAAIGPCISQAAYEVGDDFKQQFVNTDATYERFFVPGQREGHWQFDLPACVSDRLNKIGVDSFVETADCTYGDPSRFFSYRRATHRGERDYGRQISVIALAE